MEDSTQNDRSGGIGSKELLFARTAVLVLVALIAGAVIYVFGMIVARYETPPWESVRFLIEPELEPEDVVSQPIAEHAVSPIRDTDSLPRLPSGWDAPATTAANLDWRLLFEASPCISYAPGDPIPTSTQDGWPLVTLGV